MADNKPKERVVDLKAMRQDAGRDHFVLQMLIDHLLGEYPSVLVSMSKSINKGEADGLKSTAIKFREFITNFKAQAVLQDLDGLIDAAESGNLAGTPEMLDALHADLEKVRKYFEENEWEVDLY